MDHKTFFDAIRAPLFKGSLSQQQVDGLNLILSAWEAHGDGVDRHLAYVLATTHHETGRAFVPLKETGNSSQPNPPDDAVKARLTAAWKAGKLPWVKADYWSSGYFGRGYVQLTHRENYAKAGEKLGVDLVNHPDKAMEPDIAARILIRGMIEGWFTGHKLADYSSDFVSSREIVNGKDKAVLIADYALGYLDAIKAANAASSPAVEPAKPDARATARWSLLGALIDLILKLFARKATK